MVSCFFIRPNPPTLFSKGLPQKYEDGEKQKKRTVPNWKIGKLAIDRSCGPGSVRTADGVY